MVTVTAWARVMCTVRAGSKAMASVNVRLGLGLELGLG